MDIQTKISIGMQIITLGGVVFAVYLYFRSPQEKSEMNDAVFDIRLQGLEKLVTNLKDNHIHTLDTKLSQHIADYQTFAIDTTKSLTRVETLLEQILKK